MIWKSGDALFPVAYKRGSPLRNPSAKVCELCTKVCYRSVVDHFVPLAGKFCLEQTGGAGP